MREKIDKRVPRYTSLIMPTFIALKELGGSGKNNEILDQIIKDLQISDEVVDIQHKGRTDKSELSYQADWARTYLSRSGVIENSDRGVWSILPDFVAVDALDSKEIVKKVTAENAERRAKKRSQQQNTDDQPENDDPADDDVEFPDEAKPWKDRLAEVLQNMDPYGFERLSQRLLRECGFTQV